MNRKSILERCAFALRFALALFVVATTMAVACPQPEKEIPTPPDPGGVTKSESRVTFESRTATGIYFNDKTSITYDETSFQQAFNHNRKNFRIQADDQSSYLNLAFTDRLPQKNGDEAVAKVTYRTDTKGETVVIVKLKVVMIQDERMWLWNELQELGVIMPSF